MPLSAYPRPAGDNGWGIHWSPTLFGQPTDMVDHHLEVAAQLGCTWVKLLQGDAPKLEHEYLIGRMTERGIMPVLRIFQPFNEPYQHLSELVPLGVEAGVYYYELYNEPNLAGEAGGWRPGEPISVERMVDLWIPAAKAVLAGGGLPSLPALAPGGDYDDVRFLREFLRLLRERERADLLYRAWLPLHNYFLNHPLDYPNDAVNRHSVPLSADEIARRGLSAEEVERINHFRSISRLPREQGGYYVGDTVYEDSNGFLKFQAYARILQEEVGFVVPMITTEGGAIIGSAEDPRYPAVTEQDLVDLTLGAYDYMQSRPDYYFAFMPWLLANRAGNSLSANWEGAAWIREDGSTLAVVDALRAHVSRGGTPAATASPTLPPSGPQAAGTARSVETAGHRFSVPDIASVAQASSPAHPAYPLPVVPESAQPEARDRDLEVVILTNGTAEAWVVPALGARVVRLVTGAGGEALPLVERFSFLRSPAGTPGLEGGVRWLYPSPALSAVEAMAWTVEATGTDPEPFVVLRCREPRSRTELTLRLSLAPDGALSASLSATNTNGHARTVSLGLSSSASSTITEMGGPAEAIVPPGSTHQWSFRVLPVPGLPAQPATTPTPWVGPTVVSSPAPSASPGRPAALVTPVPANRPAGPASGVATPSAPATPVPPAAPVPPGPAAGSSIRWDSRLDGLGVTLAESASPRWELVEARYEDERESGGNHHIFVELIGAGPDSAPADVPWVSWSDGRQNLELKRSGAGWTADFPMYGTLGAYTVGVGSSSDQVRGLGLPGKHHVNFRLTFRLCN